MPRTLADPATEPPRLGLAANWRQFWLLVLVNAFVGAMVGLERAIMPLLAEQEFGLRSTSAALAFIATFGLVKAGTNLMAGRLGDRVGRKRVLVAGWLVGLPVPFLLIWAPNWTWVVVANVLLGINQGLTWSTTVIMKIDLVGPARRGLAMGLNEFAGYGTVALAAFVSGQIAARAGLRPAPFYLGIAVATIGLALSVLFVRETVEHARHEAAGDRSGHLSAGAVFLVASWRDRRLLATSQAGLVNNMNDGTAWGLLPLFFAARGLSVQAIAVLAAIYPATWSIAQLGTGALSDRIGRKWLIVGGMLLQGFALVVLAVVGAIGPWIACCVLLGLGTAMVYPTLLAAVGDIAHPSWRASAVGVYRFWRDVGYAVGAMLAGGLADAFGMEIAIGAVGGLTACSGLLVARLLPETLPRKTHRDSVRPIPA